MYRSPSQNDEEFEIFKTRWDETITNITSASSDISTFIGDFNARNSSWWANDIDNNHGLEINEIANYNGLHQLINSPTHILPNSLSCIDLCFTNQPNLVYESGVIPSLFPRCHHQIIYAKFNFQVYFPPAYKRTVWQYNKANVNLSRRILADVNWANILSTMSVVDWSPLNARKRNAVFEGV